MQLSQDDILKILIDTGYLTEEEIAANRQYAISHRDDIMNVLKTRGYLSGEIIGQAIAEHLQVPYINLRFYEPKKEFILQIPEADARKMRVVVCDKNDKSISLASDDPANEEMKTAIGAMFPDLKATFFYASTPDIDEMFTRYNKSLQELFDEISQKSEHVAPELLDAIFLEAIATYVSDIHFEPYMDKVTVRFRIDGVLVDMATMDRVHYENVLNRIKVSSNIRLDMHAKTQDGSMQFHKDSLRIDLRTSIIPTIEGEKIVMRVLSSYVKGL